VEKDDCAVLELRKVLAISIMCGVAEPVDFCAAPVPALWLYKSFLKT
jgi:hypothetical protein